MLLSTMIASELKLTMTPNILVATTLQWFFSAGRTFADLHYFSKMNATYHICEGACI
jgi:hypothetical protein